MFRYIEENYSKIRDVERELSNLTMEMKLTAGPKKAGFYILSLLCALSGATNSSLAFVEL